MFKHGSRRAVILLFGAALPLFLGSVVLAGSGSWWSKSSSKCEKNKCKPAEKTACPSSQCPPRSLSDLPPSAEPGKCYAKVFMPAQFKTVSERILVKDAGERIEITPAQYKWVEERILVKEASCQLEEVPAEYKWEDQCIEVKPAHCGWEMEKNTTCMIPSDKPRDAFCYICEPAETRTIRVQRLVKPASTRSVNIPAEYSTVRKQVLACPASAKKICMPAEYQDVQKTAKVCDATIKWDQVLCANDAKAETVNKIKGALSSKGFTPGPMDGKLSAADWAALNQFQERNGLAIGELSYETMNRLGVPVTGEGVG